MRRLDKMIAELEKELYRRWAKMDPTPTPTELTVHRVDQRVARAINRLLDDFELYASE